MSKARTRKRRSESEWAEILARFAGPGLTVVEFCRREGLSPSSFQRWRSRLGTVAASQFVELVPAAAAEEPETARWSLEIAPPNGDQLRLRG